MAYSFGAPSTVQNGLVFYMDPANKDTYPGSGTVATDLTSGITGSLRNGTSVESNNAGVFQFDGTNDFANFNTVVNSQIKPTSAYSVSAWFKIDDNSGTKTIISNGNSVGYMVWCQSGRLKYYHNATSGGFGQIASNATFSTNTWNNFLIHWEANAKTTIYFNGKYDNQSSSTKADVVYGATNDLVIGRYTAIGYYFEGQIGPISIYNRVLSPEEILKNYNALKGRFS